MVMVDQGRKQRHFLLNAICGPKAREVLDFVCTSIANRSKIVKSTYLSKNRFIKATLF